MGGGRIFLVNQLDGSFLVADSERNNLLHIMIFNNTSNIFKLRHIGNYLMFGFSEKKPITTCRSWMECACCGPVIYLRRRTSTGMCHIGNSALFFLFISGIERFYLFCRTGIANV